MQRFPVGRKGIPAGMRKSSSCPAWILSEDMGRVTAVYIKKECCSAMSSILSLTVFITVLRFLSYLKIFCSSKFYFPAFIISLISSMICWPPVELNSSTYSSKKSMSSSPVMILI